VTTYDVERSLADRREPDIPLGIRIYISRAMEPAFLSILGSEGKSRAFGRLRTASTLTRRAGLPADGYDILGAALPPPSAKESETKFDRNWSCI